MDDSDYYESYRAVHNSSHPENQLPPWTDLSMKKRLIWIKAMMDVDDALATKKPEIQELVISKSGSTFTVDQPSLPGSPSVGRASTIEAAIGSWFISHQTRLGFRILNDPSAEKAVADYKERKLSKR